MRRQLAGLAAALTAAGLLATTVIAAGPAAPAGEQAPIAAPPAAPGTVSGLVVSDSGAPLADADVALSVAGHQVQQVARTDESGHFAFADVPAGRYTLAAKLHGFGSMEYGASRTDRPGMIVVVAGGQQIASLRIALPRLAAIGGVVRKPDGTPT